MRPSAALLSRRLGKSRFANDPKTPLEELLRTSLGYRGTYLPRDSKDFKNPARSDLTSEQLCDDIIGYLAPTLQQHKGCTLIDVNPGACLWSSKLHDFLKPRQHILMEPHRRYFEPFIKPLLDKPGSRYRHTFLQGFDDYDHAKNWDALFADSELFPPRSPPIDGDPQLRKLDPGVLVTGNLVRQARAKRGFGYGAKFATVTARHMAVAALSNTHAHKYGLVRMLLWVPDEEKAAMIAYWESLKTALNTTLSMACDVTEVVGCTPQRNAWKSVSSVRPPFMEAAAEAKVKQSMEDLGIRMPNARIPNINEKIKSSVEEVEFVSPLQPTTDRFLDLEADVEKTRARLKRIMEWPKGKLYLPAAEMEWVINSITFPQCLPCAEYHAKHTFKRGKAYQLAVFSDLCMLVVRHEATLKALLEDRTKLDPEALAEQTSKNQAAFEALFENLGNYEKLADLEKRILAVVQEKRQIERLTMKNMDTTSLDAKQDRAAQLEASIRSLDTQLWQHIDARGKQWSGLVLDSLNEQVSFFSNPTILPRDDRLYEPFKTNMNEFWPATEVALLDMTPVERDLAVPGLASSSDAARVCQEIVKYLFTARRSSVPAALDRLAPNAAQDLIPMSPSITDARKGGRLDPQRLSVSMLTEEMIVELVKAFIEWPFRPELVKLADQFEGVDDGFSKEQESDEDLDDDQ